MSGFFEGFDLEYVKLPAGTCRCRYGRQVGNRKPVLFLLHGNPQTHAMWHAVAPALARDFTVVCPDLRGYGFSHKPATSGDHLPYSKREMAKDIIALADYLCINRFSVLSHDRGSRVAHRLALDSPERIERLAVLDIVPTLEHFERTDMSFAMGYYHWFWLAQPHPVPETFIKFDPEFWFDAQTGRKAKNKDFFHAKARADYLSALQEPGTIEAICEDYRAASTIDLDHDRQSRGEGRKVGCDILVLWGSKGRIGDWYDPLAIWRSYCNGVVTGGPVNSGHYLAEETPDEVLAAFAEFCAG